MSNVVSYKNKKKRIREDIAYESRRINRGKHKGQSMKRSWK